MSDNYDAIVIGAGHNGLVCAAMLGRAGKKVLVVEANDQVGGAAKHENSPKVIQFLAVLIFSISCNPR